VSSSLGPGLWLLPLLLALGVGLSTAGSVNGSVMAGGRALGSMAREGLGPPGLGKLNRRGAPYVALCVQVRLGQRNTFFGCPFLTLIYSMVSISVPLGCVVSGAAAFTRVQLLLSFGLFRTHQLDVLRYVANMPLMSVRVHEERVCPSFLCFFIFFMIFHLFVFLSIDGCFIDGSAYPGAGYAPTLQGFPNPFNNLTPNNPLP